MESAEAAADNDGREFRSVTCHESLSTKGLGYLLIQGALEPSKSSNSSFCWTRKSLQHTLEQRLVVQGDNLLLPIPAVSVDVLDKESPFTRFRLTFPDPIAARDVMLHCRSNNKSDSAFKMTPATLFANLVRNVADTGVVAADGHNHRDIVPTFGNRSLQISFVTPHPRRLPHGWPKSNAPKFRRLLARPGENVTVLQQERQSTRFLFMSNLVASDSMGCWQDPWIAAMAVRCGLETLLQTDSNGNENLPFVEVFAAGDAQKLSKYCHVGVSSAAQAQRLYNQLQGQSLKWTWQNNGVTHSVDSGELFLDYAAVTNRSRRKQCGDPKREPTRSECTSTTDHVSVPGLYLYNDFVSVEEEAALVATLTGPQAPWAPPQTVASHNATVRRRVQHYGYVFDYQIADVLRDRKTEPGADCPPLPVPTRIKHNTAGETRDQPTATTTMKDALTAGKGWDVFANVIERTRQHIFDKGTADGCRYSDINQVTINEYTTGEGIGSHVDTPSAFGDGLISISLNSGCTMEFRQVSSLQGGSIVRKLVYLPRRSCLLMSGDARYHWEHMIVSRATDTYNGKVLRRGTRVSLTLRTALDTDGSVLTPYESSSFPPVWGSQRHPEESGIETPSCERDHVHKVYDAIATQWHHTRGRRGVLWPGATTFIQNLPAGSLVADIGCGDGKYFPAIWEAGSYVIGTDISVPLLGTALHVPSEEEPNALPESRRISPNRQHLRNRPALVAADCMSTPLRTSSCDAAICIAVLHHLSTNARRRRCLEELARVVRPGGMINVQAWAMDQEASSRRKFAVNDVFVPFNAQPKYLQKWAPTKKEEDQAAETGESQTLTAESTAEVCSKALNAQFDEEKGLVVFQRYCHLYRRGELEEIAASVPELSLMESGFESGNYYIIMKVKEEA